MAYAEFSEDGRVRYSRMAYPVIAIGATSASITHIQRWIRPAFLEVLAVIDGPAQNRKLGAGYYVYS